MRGRLVESDSTLSIAKASVGTFYKTGRYRTLPVKPSRPLCLHRYRRHPFLASFLPGVYARRARGPLQSPRPVLHVFTGPLPGVFSSASPYRPCCISPDERVQLPT